MEDFQDTEIELASTCPECWQRSPAEEFISPDEDEFNEIGVGEYGLSGTSDEFVICPLCNSFVHVFDLSTAHEDV